MQKLRWLILSGMVAVSCNKSSINSNIVGKWELSEEIGGLAGVNSFPPGNGVYIQFNAAMTYKEFNSTTAVATAGTYRIVNTGLADGKNILLSQADGSSQVQSDSVLVSGDQLQISMPPRCCDIIYAFEYRRSF